MKRYKITFVVEGDNHIDAMNQGEKYLNTGNRCVDFNMEGPIDTPVGNATEGGMPATAKRLD